MTDAAHSAIMSVGITPPSPSELSKIIEDVLVKKNLVNKKCTQILHNIYTSAKLDDNTEAFFGLVNDNLKGLGQMIEDQPNIWR